MKSKLYLKQTMMAILGLHLTACCCTGSGPVDSVRTADVGYVNSDYAPIDTRLDDYSMQFTVPERIHTSGEPIAKIAPVKAKDSDKQWVSSQPTNGYTIELARDAKASRVATVLHQAPKNERMAEVASSNGYVGVYGSYQTAEEAQKAHAALPEGIRNDAKIKPWSEVH